MPIYFFRLRDISFFNRYISYYLLPIGGASVFQQCSNVLNGLLCCNREINNRLFLHDRILEWEWSRGHGDALDVQTGQSTSPLWHLPQSILGEAHSLLSTYGHRSTSQSPTNPVFVFRWAPTWSPNTVTSPPPTHSSPAPLMRSSTQSPSTQAVAATTASRPGRSWAATGTRGRSRWRPTCGCSTSRRFPVRRPCWLTTVINWQWSTDGSPPCHHLEACCRITTGPCPCPSGQASIQKWVGNPAASHYPGTAGSTPSWLLPPRRLNRENPSIIAWSGPEILVRPAESSYPKKYLREQNIYIIIIIITYCVRAERHHTAWSKLEFTTSTRGFISHDALLKTCVYIYLHFSNTQFSSSWNDHIAGCVVSV